MRINSTFYKYKSLSNFEFLLDMVLKERLYSAEYHELNDPMEGVIKVDNTVPVEREFEWERILKELKIVCFTKSSESALMWSHYADGGKGCVVEFELLENQEYHKVSYLKKPVIGQKEINKEKAIEILTFKEKPWKYEAEYRCITEKDRFLPVNIKSITFGPRANEESVKMIMHIITLCKPGLGVYRLRQSGVFKKPQCLIGAPRKLVVPAPGSNECSKCLATESVQRDYVGMHRGWKNY